MHGFEMSDSIANAHASYVDAATGGFEDAEDGAGQQPRQGGNYYSEPQPEPELSHYYGCVSI